MVHSKHTDADDNETFMAYLLTKRPVEMWAFRLWPLALVVLWITIIVSGGVLGYNGWIFVVTSCLAGLSSAVHLFRPYCMMARYVALVINEIAMIYRAMDYILLGRQWRLALAGFMLWGTVAVAKLVVFLLSSQLVEIRYAQEGKST